MKRFAALMLSMLLGCLCIVPAFAEETGQEIKYDSSWRISVSSDMGNSLYKAFDGDEKTYWHSHYTHEGSQITGHDEPPHIITVDFRKDMNISGWKYLCRRVGFTGTIFTYNIYSSLDGTSFEKIYSGKFDYGNNYSDISPKTAFWGDTKMRALKIEILTSDGGYGTAAEISFFAGADGPYADGYTEDNFIEGKTVLSRDSWTAKTSSDRGNSVGNILDGKPETYWHSHYTNDGPTITGHDEPPFDLEINFGKETELSGLMLNQREDSVTGRILRMDVYVKNGGDYIMIVKERAFKNAPGIQIMDFGVNIKASEIKLEITSTVSGYGTLGELYAVEPNGQYEAVTLDNAYERIRETEAVEIDSSAFKLIYEGDSWGEHNPENAIDGNEGTLWQTGETKYPITFEIDLGAVHTEITEIAYVPRDTPDHHGLWINYSIYISEDGENYTLIKERESFTENLDKKVINFGTGVKARYFRFEINYSVANRLSCSEIYFYETRKSAEAEKKRLFEDRKKFVLKIGTPEITTIAGDTKETTKIDAAPFIEDGSTLIPVRGLFELMGAEILWDPVDQTVVIKDETHKILLQIENKLVQIEDPKLGNFTMTLICPPLIVSGRSFIPLRFISERLGYEVIWNAETSEITIY